MIKEITKRQAQQLLKSGEESGKYEPLGNFIMKNGEVWVGFANEEGSCYVEESKSKDLIKKWLEGEIDVDELYEENQ